LVVGGAVALTRHGSTGIPPAGGGVAAWPARGSLAGDAALTNAARQAWEAALLPKRELPHRDVRVLYAEHTIAGDVVVLTGTDGFGKQRVAEFDTDPTSTTAFRHRMRFVADLLAPTGKDAGLVAINAPRHTPRKSHDALLVVLTAPGTKHVQWQNEAGPWQPVPTVNGAGTVVHIDFGTTIVRAGHDGEGIQTMGDFFPFGMPGAEPLAHDLDPAEIHDSAAVSAFQTCDKNGCSVSAGGGVTVSGTGPNGSWTNLLDSGVMSTHEWWEFAGEVQLYTDTFLPRDGNTSGPTWSDVLPDGTGMFLEFYKPSGNPTHLIAYVDRPEWSGGSVVDVVPPNGQLSALAVLVPTTAGRTLDVVVADGLRPQWRSGTGAWQSMKVRDNVASAVVGTAHDVTWRVVDANGSVVASGNPHVVNAKH
ncbi:MAG: hypothetical protein JO074_06865, partial [Frankiales bacterium]|nr:hypothetical protein [Frankiales bacterium]